MSIADEARAEAERRWPLFDDDDENLTYPLTAVRQARRAGFQFGAEWLASRKPEAAPTEACEAYTTVASDPWRGCELPVGHDGRHVYSKRLYGAYPEYGIEAAPSDTEDVLAMLDDLNASGGIAYDAYSRLHDAVVRLSPKADEAEPVCELFPGTREALDALTIRASQPVQVEVTEQANLGLASSDELFDEIRARIVMGEFEPTTEQIKATALAAEQHEQWRYVGETPRCECGAELDDSEYGPIGSLMRHQARVSLVAALGGGDHADK